MRNLPATLKLIKTKLPEINKFYIEIIRHYIDNDKTLSL